MWIRYGITSCYQPGQKEAAWPWNHSSPPSFLLRTETAQRLFQEYAASLPVIDYHCHLSPADIADNRRFSDLTQLWIDCDPYKWRAMRLNGIGERLITGDSSARERFTAWAHTLPRLAGNPLFHWSCMELSRYFGIDEILGPDNAARIWDHCNEWLKVPDLQVQGLLKKARVEIVCTSDELLDDLSPHAALEPETDGLCLLPSLRGDSILAFQDPDFAAWLERLAKLTSLSVASLQDYKKAVSARLDSFSRAGCLLADHSLDRFSFDPADEKTAEGLFQAVLGGRPLQARELMGLQSHVLVFLGGEYARRGWAMQLHLGAQRQTSTRLRNLLGPAGGFTCMGNSVDVAALCAFLDCLESRGSLPRTVLYNLNPADTEMLASLSGSFVQEGVVCKVQPGPA